MDIVGTSSNRVSDQTAPDVNASIKRNMEMRVCGYATQPESVLTERLRELDREWDTEHCLQTGASFFTMFGTAMGATVNRKWLILPGVVGSMVFLHALQGWYPLLPLFRRLGLRTREEIGEEKMALKALRGDFTEAILKGSPTTRAEAALCAVRL